jgi:hypothetical protein
LPLHSLSPLDTAGVAASLGKMDVGVGCFGTAKQPFEERRERIAFRDVGIDHHSILRIGAHGQHAARENVGKNSDTIENLLRVLANEDRPPRAVRRVHGLVLEWQQEKTLSGFGIFQRHPAGKTGLTVGDYAAYSS